ncbi:MAG: amidohydrolase family protein [Desulforhopalus sp.]|nr:amidohydrolase family protein [Desulforhopalus sp.]
MAQERKRFRVGWMVDGISTETLGEQLLTVENGVITEVEPWTDSLGVAAEELIDLSHCTVLPPLTDACSHLCMSATTDLTVREKQLASSCEELLPVMKQHAGDYLSHGVFAVCDGGDYGGYALRFAKEQEHPRFTLRTSGRAWHRKGRYGRLIGRTPESYGLNLPDAFREAQRRGEDAGAEFVKIVQSGVNSLTEYGVQTPPQFSLEELKELVQRAVECGKKVMVYANGQEAVRIAVEAGCHAIEHGFFMGEENLRRLRDSEAVWVPTVFTMRAYRQNLDILGGHGSQVVLDSLLEHQLAQLSRARELGVKTAVGTDAGSLGVLHGEGVMEEMKLFRRAGYSLGETIRCSSVTGGDLLGMENFGRLRPGAPATFLASRGTPSQLPRKIIYLEAIYVEGECVS